VERGSVLDTAGRARPWHRLRERHELSGTGSGYRLSGRRSETEILLAYGPTRFASKAGQLAGNHFLTIREDLDRLAQICRTVLWQGATPITLRAA